MRSPETFTVETCLLLIGTFLRPLCSRQAVDGALPLAFCRNPESLINQMTAMTTSKPIWNIFRHHESYLIAMEDPSAAEAGLHGHGH